MTTFFWLKETANSEGGKIEESVKNIGQDQFKETKQAEEDAEDGNEDGEKQGKEGQIGEELKYKTNDKTDNKACEQINTVGKPSNKNTENMLPNQTKKSFDQLTEDELQKHQQKNSELQLPLVSYTTLLYKSKVSTYKFEWL